MKPKHTSVPKRKTHGSETRDLTYHIHGEIKRYAKQLRSGEISEKQHKSLVEGLRQFAISKQRDIDERYGKV